MPVDFAWTLIPDAYTSQDFHEVEQEEVFAKSWVPVCVTDEVREPGDFLVVEVAGRSIIVARNQEARREMAAEAEGLLQEEGRQFLDWWDGLEAVPVVNRLRVQLEEIREQELQKALSRMGPELSARERKVVEALSKGIINKILHAPTTNLRAPQPRQQRHLAMKVLQELFELHDDASA